MKYLIIFYYDTGEIIEVIGESAGKSDSEVQRILSGATRRSVDGAEAAEYDFGNSEPELGDSAYYYEECRTLD